jgi:purine-binding chemotaxis protein CheW
VMMGVVVDSVSEVLNVTASEIDDTPEFGGDKVSDYLLGLAKVKGTVKILLDLDRVLGTDGQLDLQAA